MSVSAALAPTSYEGAAARAQTWSARHKRVSHVVYAGEGQYAFTDDDGLDTYHLGATPLVSFDETGEPLDG